MIVKKIQLFKKKYNRILNGDCFKKIVLDLMSLKINFVVMSIGVVLRGFLGHKRSVLLYL